MCSCGRGGLLGSCRFRFRAGLRRSSIIVRRYFVNGSFFRLEFSGIVAFARLAGIVFTLLRLSLFSGRAFFIESCPRFYFLNRTAERFPNRRFGVIGFTGLSLSLVTGLAVCHSSTPK